MSLFKALGFFVVCLAFVLSAVFLSRWITGEFPDNSVYTPSNTVTSTPIVINPKPSEYPDFDSLPKLHKLSLVTNFETWTPTAKTESNKTSTKIVVQKGTISKAYIYVRASLDNKALTQWESIFVQMNNKGGHLFRPQSLSVPPSEQTELLFALNYIPYLPHHPYSDKKTPTIIDWFTFFKDKAEINVYTFISSLRPAKLEELTIYYQCVSNDECELIKK
jgi:hypothetical protein